MTFLNPGFLWFLFLALIPVIIHLLNLRPFRTVLFTNLRFLRRIESENRTRRKLKEYIILLLRVLAIVALVLAFARPVGNVDTSQLPCQDKVVIYLDNSFSMGVRGRAGVNLELAKKKAFEIVQAYGHNARFVILTNDFLPSQFQSYLPARASDIIAHIQVSGQVRRLSGVVSKIKNIVSHSDGCKHFVYVISDFQKTSADLDKVSFPAGWRVFLLSLQPGRVNNVSIDSVFFARPYHSLGGRDSLVVELRNYGQEKVNNLRLELWLNDSLRGFQNVSIKAEGTQLASFTFVDQKQGWNSAVVNIDDHLMRFDNQLYFSFFVKDRYNVLLIGRNVSVDLKKLYSYKFFTSSVADVYHVGPEQLGKYDVVVLDRVKDLSTGMINYLKDFVQSGGSVVILPYAGDFKAVNSMLITLGLSAFDNVDSGQTQVWNIDLHSQLYQGAVLKYEQNALLPKVKDYLKRRVSYATERPLLVAKNGTVLLSEAHYGRGKVYVFAFPMDRAVTDFVDNPLFVVTFVNIGLQTNGQSRLYYVLGRDQWIEARGVESEFFKIVGKNISYVPSFRYVAGQLRLGLMGSDLPAGNYKIIDQNDSLVSIVGLNYSRHESDLEFYTNGQIEKIFNQRKIKNVRIIENILDDLEPVISRDIHVPGLWKIFVVLAILFLILEVLVNRLIN